jgi:hypothetical protein
MRISTVKWAPDGPPIAGVDITVTTAALYQPNASYMLFDYNESQETASIIAINSDAQGRISFSVNHEPHQIGIHAPGDPAEIVFLDYIVDGGSEFLLQDEEASLRVRLLNRGAQTVEGVTISMHSPDAVVFNDTTVVAGTILAGESVWSTEAFALTAGKQPPQDGSPWKARMYMTITDNQGNVWKDEFDVPVMFTVDEFTGIEVDDGRQVSGDVFGTGNGNGIPEPGEKVMLYYNGNRLRLYTDDPQIVRQEGAIHADMLPSVWPDGTTLSSIVSISTQGQADNTITFLACYETKEHATINRNVHWGTVTLVVENTVPVMPGDDHKAEFTITPNPCHGKTFIRLNRFHQPIVSVSLSDMNGKCVYSTHLKGEGIGNRSLELDLAGVKPGVYHCSLANASGDQTVRKIILLD